MVYFFKKVAGNDLIELTETDLAMENTAICLVSRKNNRFEQISLNPRLQRNFLSKDEIHTIIVYPHSIELIRIENNNDINVVLSIDIEIPTDCISKIKFSKKKTDLFIYLSGKHLRGIEFVVNSKDDIEHKLIYLNSILNSNYEMDTKNPKIYASDASHLSADIWPDHKFVEDSSPKNLDETFACSETDSSTGSKLFSNPTIVSSNEYLYVFAIPGMINVFKIFNTKKNEFYKRFENVKLSFAEGDNFYYLDRKNLELYMINPKTDIFMIFQKAQEGDKFSFMYFLKLEAEFFNIIPMYIERIDCRFKIKTLSFSDNCENLAVVSDNKVIFYHIDTEIGKSLEIQRIKFGVNNIMHSISSSTFISKKNNMSNELILSDTNNLQLIHISENSKITYIDCINVIPDKILNVNNFMIFINSFRGNSCFYSLDDRKLSKKLLIKSIGPIKDAIELNNDHKGKELLSKKIILSAGCSKNSSLITFKNIYKTIVFSKYHLDNVEKSWIFSIWSKEIMICYLSNRYLL
ncbi:MAG: hypothetical protein MHPSP_001001 [Paramarteilia canceri]